MGELAKGENIVLREMANMELMPVTLDDSINKKDYKKISMDKVGNIGLSLSSLMPTVGQTTQTTTESFGGLYKAVFPDGVSGHLAMAKDGSGNLGAIVQDGKGVVGQARFQEMSDVAATTQTTVAMINPAMVFMAIALVDVEKKLSDIEVTQESILKHLERQARSEVQGDFITLTDIMSSFKYNWQNESFLDNKSKLVQDIRRSAEQKIVFYLDEINETLSKKQNLIHNNMDVQKNVDALATSLQNYRQSLYVYSLSTFLEVLLEENYTSDLIDHIKEKLYGYSSKYKMMYSRCYDALERLNKDSIESILSNGTGNAMSAVGKTMEKVPLLNKTPIDGALKTAGRDLKNVEKDSLKKKMKDFRENKDSKISQFIDGIDQIGVMYNKPMELAIGEDAIYYRLEAY